MSYSVNFGVLILCSTLIAVSGAGIGNNKTEITALVAKLRSDLTVPLDSVLGSDQSFRRYLQQSKNDVSKALMRIQNTASWRVTNNVNALVNEDVSTLKDTLPYECTGKTNDGNPVFYIPLGKWNLRKIQRNRLNSRLQSYLIQLFENSLRAAEKEVNNVTRSEEEENHKSIFIIDLQGYTLRQLLSGYGRSLSTLVRAAQIYESHYPNTVKKWYVIRAPRNFRVMWFLARRFVSRDVVNNVEVYSRYSLRWRNAIRSSIPQSAIPASLRL